MVVPSCAITTVLMVFGPTFSGMAAEAEPDAVVAPSTFTVAPGSLVTGVMVIDVLELVSLAV